MEPEPPDQQTPSSPWASPSADTTPETSQAPPLSPPPVSAGSQTGNPILSAAEPAPQERQRRRWPWIVALSIVGVLAIAGGAFSYVTYQRGNDWKERALDAESEADDLSTQLTASEEDVATLEARVGTLADEKAAVEDEREIVEGERDIATGLAVLAADAADKTQTCLVDVNILLSGVIDSVLYNTDVSYLLPTADRAEINCAAADESYLAFSNAVDGL